LPGGKARAAIIAVEKGGLSAKHPALNRNNQKAPELALPPSKTDENAPASKPDKDKAQQDVFMREVDEALRQDEMAGLFKRYGMPLLAVIVIGLAGLGGYLWWDNQQKTQAGQRGEELVVALDSLEAGNIAAAKKQLAPLAEDDGNGSAIAARLLDAGIALQEQRASDARKIYAGIAADESAPQPYRDLATVREVSTAFDTMKPEEVISRLAPLVKDGGPWFGPAAELTGLAYLKQGKEDLAGPLFAKIARDEESPDSLRSRARQMAGLLGVDAIDDAEKIANSGAAPQPAAPAR
jgi:hypothetical protein